MKLAIIMSVFNPFYMTLILSLAGTLLGLSIIICFYVYSRPKLSKTDYSVRFIFVMYKDLKSIKRYTKYDSRIDHSLYTVYSSNK